MATLKSIKRGNRGESLRGRFMVDTVRGVIRVRKWPKKRGTPKSADQLWWIDWFRQANKLAKYVDGATMARAIQLTAKTGMYPRDIILKAMRGRLYTWQDQYGKVWYPMAAVQDISESLDVLAQTIGSVLVRAVDRWRPAGPSSPLIGDALVYQGDDAPPVWSTLVAAVTQQDLPGTPITCDDTVNEYVFDVQSYAEVIFILSLVGFAANDHPRFRLSIDGGTSYKAGASDYRQLRLSSTVESGGLVGNMPFQANGAVADHTCIGKFTNLRASRALMTADVSVGSGQVSRRESFTQFNGPITHIKLYADSGNNFDAGNIHVSGLLGL